jgi:hypothetical protein
MLSPIIKHSEKVLYVRSYLTSEEKRPLMIVGEKNTGKSSTILEMASLPPVSICIISEGEPVRFIPSMLNPGKLKILIHSSGTSVEYDFARFLNAIVVRFERDPECIRYF